MAQIQAGGPGRTTADSHTELLFNQLHESFGKIERIDPKALSNGYPERPQPRSEPL